MIIICGLIFRLIWASVCIFLFFLAAIWVFALLLVNVFGIDSNILGWVFMVASITLVKNTITQLHYEIITIIIVECVDVPLQCSDNGYQSGQYSSLLE